MTRDELAELIKKRKTELKTAGVIHRKDLGKNIRRLERELRDYDRFKERTGKENSGFFAS